MSSTVSLEPRISAKNTGIEGDGGDMNVHNSNSGSSITGDDASNAMVPPVSIGSNLAGKNNPAGRFLLLLDRLIGELNSSGGVLKNRVTLDELKQVCLDPNFKFKMNLAHCNSNKYPNLGEIEPRYFKVYTPLSLILEYLSNRDGGTQPTIELLELISNPTEILPEYVYLGTEYPGHPVEVTDNKEVQDWLIENGATTVRTLEGLFSSDINITKLYHRLRELAYTSDEESSSLKEEIQKLFTASLKNNERYFFTVHEDNVSSNIDYTDDAVSLLLGQDLSRLPVEFVLGLIDIAANENYNFSAYGKDYGAGNLLYKVCEDETEAPDLRIVESLVNNGLNPNSEISRFRSWAGIVLTSNDLNIKELSLSESAFPKTPIELVEHHLASGQSHDERSWQNILNLFES